jgi:general secretion pathway protein I
MRDTEQRVGCSLWLIGALIAIFAAEWIVLRRLLAVLDGQARLLATLGIILLTIVGSWLVVYLRIKRRNGPHAPLRPRKRRGESGESLIELLIAVAIISMALVAFIVSLSTGAMGVGHTTRRTTALNLATSQLEMIKSAAYNSAGYTPIAAPPGYTVQLAATEIAVGLQQVTTTVRYDGDVLVRISNYKVDR